jgi:hypothetical protein
MIWSMLTAPLRHFAQYEEGSSSLEAILIWPLLLWAYGATFVYFDAFKAKNQAIKASYTVSDTISREYNAVNDTYIATMYDMLNMLSNSNHPAKMRISSIQYRASANGYRVVWSKAAGNGMLALNNSTIDQILSSLPVMPDGEQVIVVETKSLYEPFMNVGCGAIEHKNIVVTRPRFVAHICFQSDQLICSA